MKNTYELRDDKGILKAQISDRFMQEVVTAHNGTWEPYRVEGKPDRSKYVIKEDIKFNHEHCSIFMWKGDYLIPVR